MAVNPKIWCYGNGEESQLVLEFTYKVWAETLGTIGAIEVLSNEPKTQQAHLEETTSCLFFQIVRDTSVVKYFRQQSLRAIGEIER